MTNDPFRNRRWSSKFAAALHGIRLAIVRDGRLERGWTVHLSASALAVGMAFVLRLSAVEWGLIIGAIGLVLTAELFNESIESLSRSITHEPNDAIRRSLDIAAGAVFVASLMAVILGAIIFVTKLWQNLA